MSEAAFGDIWWNGHVCPAEVFSLPPDHEALLYGLGCFTTTRTWFRGRTLWYWEEHRRRLARTAEFLRLPMGAEDLPAESDLAPWLSAVAAGANVAVRINLAARPSGHRDIWAVARPMPDDKPMRLTRAASPIATDDRFANKKTFHYGARALAHRAAVERGFETALLLDAQGNVLEAAHGNFFARFSDGWATPPLGGGVLDGIIRAELLQNFPIRERPIPYASLGEAQEACLTNSVRGVAPIVQIDGWSYPVTLANDTWNAVLAPLPASF